MLYISYAVLLKGAEKSTRKEETLQQLKRLTQQITVNYQVSSKLCEHYATQFTQLNEAGTTMGANNLWLACHALSQNATLVNSQSV
jgi:tRNA(fMet)-specific endonuclease VapC